MSTQNDNPQFLLNITTMPKAGYERQLSPDQKELDAIAILCGLVAIHSFDASIKCRPWHKDGITISGHIKSKIEQTCVVSLEPVFDTIDTEFSAHFVPETSKLALPPKQVDGEIVFEFEGEDAPDVIEGEEIDLWNVVLEYFNLEIDPFPRAEGQQLDTTSSHNGPTADDDEDSVSPFAVLAALKRNDS